VGLRVAPAPPPVRPRFAYCHVRSQKG